MATFTWGSSPLRDQRAGPSDCDTGVFAVAPVDDNVVRRALALAWPDFEDAVCAAAAEASGCDALVTRDPDAYPNAPFPVIDPAAALGWLTQE